MSGMVTNTIYVFIKCYTLVSEEPLGETDSHAHCVEYNFLFYTYTKTISKNAHLGPICNSDRPYLLNSRIKLAQNFPAGQITTRNLQVVKTCNVMSHSKEDNAVDSANFCITSGGIRDAVP